MTTLQIVDAIIPPGSGILTISRDPAQEAISQIPSLLTWFDPAEQYVAGSTAIGFRWRDKRRGLLARAFATNKPNVVEFGPNNAPGIEFGAGGLPTGSLTNGSLIADPFDAINTTGYTVAFGCQLDEAGQGMILASAEDAAAFGIAFDSSGRITLYHDDDGAFICRGNADRRSSTFYAVVSYDYVAKRASIRVNGTLVAENNAVSTEHSGSGRLRIGGSGLTSGAGAFHDGRIGQLLTFSAPLDVPGRAAQLARVEAHLAALYT